MNELPLDRLNDKINNEDFSRLLNLHLKHTWLENVNKAVFELWCLTENENQKKLIEKLMSNFLHVDSYKLSKYGEIIAQTIENNWNLKADNTFLVAVCDEKEPDGSQMLIQSLKNKFSENWRGKNFYNSIVVGANEIKSDSNIILIDDFIGTGSTISRKVQYLRKTFTKRSISNYCVRIISIAAMEFSKENLKLLDVEYFSCEWLKKGINEHIPINERDIYIEAMEGLEDKLLENYGQRILPKFGYKRSESLFDIEAYNVPNNVFPIFWWPYLKNSEKRKTILSRI